MSDEPRVLLFSQRGLSPVISRCFSYEFEDAIRAMDRVDLLAPDYRFRSGELIYRAFNKAGRHTRALRSVNPGVAPIRIDRRYELFFAVFQFATDLPTLNALRAWRQHCHQAVCLIEELWTRDLGRLDSQLALLREFDQVLTNCRQTVEPLARAIGRPVHYIAPGIDALRFFPATEPTARCIEVYNMGRRHPATHRALLEYTGARQSFYLFDTFRGNLPVQDPAEHRRLLAEKLRRTRFFMANKAKVNEEGETGDQEEVGFRFFEGAAAGTLMIGDPPDVASFRENFDWPDAVVHLPYGSAEIAPVLAGLESAPERVERIRRDNVRNTLQRHDWVYRWEQVLDWAGLPAGEVVGVRKDRLQSLARHVS